jgi:hypothetical protein
MSFYNAFTHGMTPAPMTADETARYNATFVAARAANKASAEVFRRGGTIDEAQAASTAAYNAVMAAA